MDKHTSLKRQAQKLAQAGSHREAAEKYTKLAEEGVLEPYDLVVLGDLQHRLGNRNDAVDRYLDALKSYADSGLNRNAIALAKKIQRLAPNLNQVHRRLGELYAADGLASEATLHFLEYLTTLEKNETLEADDVEEVCIRLLDLNLPSFDVIQRIVDLGRKVERHRALASGVLGQAERARTLGDTEAQSRLVALAGELDPDATPSSGDDEAGLDFMDPGAVELNGGGEDHSHVPEDERVLSLDDLDPVAADEDASDDDISGISAADPELDEDKTNAENEVPTFDLSDEFENSTGEDAEEDADAEAAEAAAAASAIHDLSEILDVEDEEEIPGGTVIASSGNEDPDAVRARGFEFLQASEPSRAQREFMKAATLYFDRGLSREAAELYERTVELDPNHLEALRGLVEIAHINGEKAKMAHWGCELGDVLLAREMYSEAKYQFERVLAFDPANNKAQARVKRLNTMAGVQDTTYGELTPTASEVQGAQVTVREDDPVQRNQQSAFDLSEILDEFKSAVVESIPAEDAGSHYDLGVTYMEMGLLEEAGEEFEVAGRDPDHRSRSMEMLAECYRLLDRPQDAVQVLTEILPQLDAETRARAHVQVGRAQEAMGEWDSAGGSYEQALALNAGLDEARELLADLDHRREQGAA